MIVSTNIWMQLSHFIVERASNCHLSFPDLSVYRDVHESISTFVQDSTNTFSYIWPSYSSQMFYCLPPHWGCYVLQFNSWTIEGRMSHTSSSTCTYYPKGFIQSCRPSQPTHLPHDLEVPPVRICFENKSESLKRVLARYNIQMTFHPVSYIVLSHPKDPNPPWN